MIHNVFFRDVFESLRIGFNCGGAGVNMRGYVGDSHFYALTRRKEKSRCYELIKVGYGGYAPEGYQATLMSDPLLHLGVILVASSDIEAESGQVVYNSVELGEVFREVKVVIANEHYCYSKEYSYPELFQQEQVGYFYLDSVLNKIEPGLLTREELWKKLRLVKCQQIGLERIKKLGDVLHAHTYDHSLVRTLYGRNHNWLADSSVDIGELRGTAASVACLLLSRVGIADAAEAPVIALREFFQMFNSSFALP